MVIESFDGTKLFVEEHGDGPPVIFSHGFCLDSTAWRDQIEDLSRDYRCVFYDHRGHGRSSRPESGDWSMEALARDLDAVIESYGAPVAVVGHSMGGMVALRHAEMFPGRVSAMVLTDTAASDAIGGMLPEAARVALPAVRLLEEAVHRLASSSPERFDRLRRSQSDLVSIMIRMMGFGPRCDREHLGFVEAILAATPIEVLVRMFDVLRKMNVSAVLGHIEIPTLVMVGERDRMTPPSAAKRIASEIHHSELVVIDGAGHMPMIERPDVFNAHVRAFLTNPGASYGGRRLN